MVQRSFRPVVIGLAAAAVVWTVQACGSASPTSVGHATVPKASRSVPTVTVAQNSAVLQPGLAYLYIGSYLGYDKKAGIHVRVVKTRSPADALQRLVAGSVDVALPPPTPVLVAAAQGRKLGLVTPFMLRRHGEYSFSVLPGSPIRTYRQIPGKRIGVATLNAEGVTFTKATLRLLGKSPDDAKLVVVGDTGEAATAIKEGQVDALAIAGVQLAEIEGPLGVKLRVLPNPPFESGVIGNALWFRKSYLSAHPTIVRDYLRVVTKSLVFFLTNPKAALEVFFTMFPQAIPVGRTLRQAVRFYMPGLLPNLATFKPTRTCPLYGCNEPAAWRSYVSYLGLAPRKVGPIDRFYTNRFIKGINAGLAAVEAQARGFRLKK